MLLITKWGVFRVYDDLKGKIVVVTGASSGIGSAIADRFSMEGAKTYNLDLAPPKKEINKNVRFIKCDVSSEDAVRNAVSEISSRENRIDILVNNAGVESFGSVHETEEKDWDRILGTNLRGSFLVSKYCLPHMMEKGGVIEFLASIQSMMIQKRLAAYVTSKHGVIGLMKSIALDYAPKVRSIAICPGSVRTPLLEWTAVEEVGNDTAKINEKFEEWGKLYPMKRIAEPEEIASLAAFLASNEAAYITGISIKMDGGLSVFLQESVPEDQGEK
jgi:NAD(P)-dependent dehydrogenase (short-subunit alcohol dehydrogenase family)